MQTSEDNKKWLVLIAVGLGTFMAALDSSVVNSVLPLVRDSFVTDVAAIEWVVTIYLLVVSGLLLTFGRLGDMIGHRRVYLGGFVLFTLGSALCGWAPSAGWLVAFRALQALGAAMLASTSPAILTRAFPSAQRGRALGMQATLTYLGLAVGPSLGGWLAHSTSWRSVFLINLPVGIAGVLLAWLVVPRTSDENRGETFDLTGAALFLVGLVALLLGLNQGHNWGWGSAPVIGLLGGALLVLVGFVWVEKRVQHPMLDLNLFKQRMFSAALISAMCNYICVYSILFLMPFYLIQGRGMNTAEAGLLLTAQPLVMMIAAPIAGMLSDRIGSRLPAVVGSLIMAVGLFILARLDAATPRALVMLGLGLFGLGSGIFTPPNNSALMGSAARNRQGIAAGMMATARHVGMVLGVGLVGAILASFLALDAGNLIRAIQIGFTVTIGVALLGSLVSAVRGDTPRV